MIVFSKDLPNDRILLAYNNNIVRFKSDSLALTPLTAEVFGLSAPVVLYPHPDKSFYFNLKDYISVIVNTNRFADTLNPDLIGGDASSFTYNVSNGCFYEGVLQFKINFTDSTSESADRTIEVLAGVEQIENFKKNEILFTPNKISILSPVTDRTNNTTYLKFWEGYPFEFSIYNRNHPNANFKIRNISNGVDFVFSSKSKVTSMFLSDGRTDVSIEDFLPLIEGTNRLQFLIGDVDQNINLLLEKVDSDCGLYFKFLNKYSRWSYWLFSKNHSRKRTTKYLAEIDNDFENLADTTSQMLQIGKSSEETIKGIAEKLTEKEKTVLDGIIDSPKVYMFTGERFAKADVTDWIEVKVKTASFETKNVNTKTYSYVVEFELPERNTIKL